MEIGTRVGVILYSDRRAVHFLGWGTYKGHRVPALEEAQVCGGMVEMCYECKAPNPCIELDGGGTVWGCETWWGPENQIQKTLEGRNVVHVPFETFAKTRIGSGR